MDGSIAKSAVLSILFLIAGFASPTAAFAQSPETGAVSALLVKADLERAYNAYQVKDYATSLEVWSRLAAQDNPDAINNLGELYRYGFGVPVDWDKAFLLYKKAAERTDNTTAAALYNLATCYYHGIGTEKNRDEAKRLRILAANAGWSEASYDLGITYSNGLQPGDKRRALKWFRKGAVQGHADSAFSAGMLLLSFSQNYTDRNEAMVYLEVAAERGNQAAMRMMARDTHADYAMGGPKEAALKWYDALIALGDTSVVYDRAQLEKLTPLPSGYYWRDKGDHKQAYEMFDQDCKERRSIGSCYEAGLYLANGANLEKNIFGYEGNRIEKNYFGAMLLFEDVCARSETSTDSASAPLGCLPFANAVVLQNGKFANVERQQKARTIFKDSCDRNNQNTLDCYNVAFMSWDDRFGLEDESLSRTYSSRACRQPVPQKEACRMSNAWASEDNYNAYIAERSRENRNSKPSIVGGIFAALIEGAAQANSSTVTTSAATQYGEMRRQQDAARHSYVMSTYNKGSSNYGRCPTVNSPGC